MLKSSRPDHEEIKKKKKVMFESKSAENFSVPQLLPTSNLEQSDEKNVYLYSFILKLFFLIPF